MAVSTRVTLLHRLEWLAVSAVFGLFRAFPLERASALGGWIGRTIGPLTGAHATALRNLRLAFPAETEAWRARIARAMWDNLGRLAGEFPHLHAIRPYVAGGRIEVEGAERLDAVRASGRGAVFVSGHFANWEIMAAAIVQRGLPCQVTYRPANNPLIDRDIIAIRRGYGATFQAAKGREGGMGLMRALARGESVALMNDQKYSDGVIAPFFGHDAATADGPTRLALRFGVPLVPLTIERLPGVRFRVRVHDPIPIDADAPADQAVRDAVVRLNAFLEAEVRARPEAWFWVHRRWPRDAWD
jgi:KDO2-lipid IV(A) lauroyltransferase